MAKQFAYRDMNGFIYPAHPSLMFQPGLVPGNFDTESREFIPTGNPQEQVGTIVTDAKSGHNGETVLSGLKEDKGAELAPPSSRCRFYTASREGCRRRSGFRK